MPVRLGLRGTRVVYMGLHVFALAAVIYMTATGSLPIATPLLPLALLYLGYKASTAIARGIEDRDGMRRAIEATLGIHALGALWLAACALYSAA